MHDLEPPDAQVAFACDVANAEPHGAAPVRGAVLI